MTCSVLLDTGYCGGSRDAVCLDPRPSGMKLEGLICNIVLPKLKIFSVKNEFCYRILANTNSRIF